MLQELIEAGENTRKWIYDASRRKEMFATTESRIKVRLFASHDHDDALLEAPDLVAKDLFTIIQLFAIGITLERTLNHCLQVLSFGYRWLNFLFQFTSPRIPKNLQGLVTTYSPRLKIRVFFKKLLLHLDDHFVF